MPTFPGVYTQVIDKSFNNGLQSRFSCGLVGVASRGPMNVAVRIRSLADFVANFGQAIPGSYLASAVASLTGAGCDGTRVVRVGTTYSPTTAVGSGAEGSYGIATSGTGQFTTGDYVTVRQAGKATTVNARIESIASGTVVFVDDGIEAVALADTYTSAVILRSETSQAANSAEAFLTSPTYGTAIAGTAVGTRNSYAFTMSTLSGGPAVGDVVKIVQSGRATTREAQVQSVNTTTRVVTLIPLTDTETGRQAVPLQDNYSGATVSIITSQAATLAAHLHAASEGSWANTVGSTVGLRVTVHPGTKPDTKKIMIYLDGALAETVDNLSADLSSADYWATRLVNDNYITSQVLFGTEPPGNTINPWNIASHTPSNLATFSGGYNGQNLSPADYVGTIDPSVSDDGSTGLQIFHDVEAYGNLYALAVPGVTDMAVIQQLAVIATAINAIAIVDVPDNLNAREALDWTNGQGLYANSARVDNSRVAFYWNWFQTLNPFTGLEEFVPPSVGILGAMSLTFDRYSPWYATAGAVHGQLPNATAVRYPRVRDEVKQAMYGEGNVVNPILFYRGTSISIFGNLTSQRTASFLQQISVMHLVNYILKNVASIARKYVFEPNDSVVLQQLTLDGVSFMETVRVERGVETFQWICNNTNNNAATRNDRSARIDLSIIPIGALERIYLNLTVNASGAILNAVQFGPARS